METPLTIPPDPAVQPRSSNAIPFFIYSDPIPTNSCRVGPDPIQGIMSIHAPQVNLLACL